MNIVEQQSALKGLSDEQLKEMLGGGSQVPDFLIMGEVGERGKMREEAVNNKMAPVGATVKDEMMRNSGVMSIPQQAMPQQQMPQQQPQMFADGGGVRGSYGAQAPGLTGWQKIGRGISGIGSWLGQSTTGPRQAGLSIYDWLNNPEQSEDPAQQEWRPSWGANVPESANVQQYIPGAPGGGQLAPGGLQLDVPPPESSEYDPYDMSGMRERLGGIEQLMANRTSSPDGGWTEYMKQMAKQNAINNKQNQGMALANMGFSIAAGKDPNALTNVANADPSKYFEAADAAQKQSAEMIKSGLHKEAAIKAMEDGRIEDAVKLFGTYNALQNTEIQATTSKAKIALLALKAKGKNGNAKLLENILKNIDKIAGLDDERRVPIMNAMNSLIEQAMAGEVKFDVDELKTLRDAAEE